MIISEEDYANYHSWCREFINEYCIHRVPPWEEGLPKKLDPNKKAKWQIYPRRALFHPKFNKLIGLMFLQKVYDTIGHFEFQLGGVETGGTPLICTIPMIADFYRIDIPAFSIRKKQKEYGLKNWLEGVPDPHLPVMICDDFSNSGNSMVRGANRVYLEGLPLFNYCFAIANKSKFGSGSIDQMLNSGIQTLYLFDLDDFDMTYEEYMAKKEEKADVTQKMF